MTWRRCFFRTRCCFRSESESNIGAQHSQPQIVAQLAHNILRIASHRSPLGLSPNQILSLTTFLYLTYKCVIIEGRFWRCRAANMKALQFCLIAIVVKKLQDRCFWEAYWNASPFLEMADNTRSPLSRSASTQKRSEIPFWQTATWTNFRLDKSSLQLDDDANHKVLASKDKISFRIRGWSTKNGFIAYSLDEEMATEKV